MKNKNNYNLQSIWQGLFLSIAVALTSFSTLNAQTFNLISPADQTALTVEGNGSDTISVSWHADIISTPMYSWVLLSATNDTLVVLPSDNSGMDTTLSLTKGAIDNLFESLNVPFSGTAPVNWYVASTNGTISNVSDTFALSLTRGSVGFPFDLTFPPNGLLLNVEGDGTNSVDITWKNAGNGVSYAWWLDVAGGNFSNPIIIVPSNNNGADTTLTLDFATIDAVLAGAGINLGDTANLQWAVSAVAAGDTIISTSINTIDLVRGAISSPFDLVSPANGTLLNVEGNGSATVDITWNNAGNGVTYAWWLDVAGGNFSNPIIVVPSNNNGADTALTLDFATIDAVLAGAGVNLGDTANLQWAVSAFAGNDTLLSTSVNTIDLVRGAISSPFDLVFPPNGLLLNVEGNGTNTVDITWENSGNGVTYAWWLDVAGGNFSNPIIVVPSNNNGADTALTLDFATIDAVLAGAGVNLGDTANLQWAVSAFAGNDTLLSTSVNTIDLVRGAISSPFDLVFPPNGLLLNVEGNGTNTVDITWGNSGNGVTYAWWLDVAGGNFSNPIIVVPSNNNGADTALTLDFATIDAVLAGAGVNLGDTANLQWAVSAFAGNDTLLSTSVNTIDLVRGAISSPFDLVSPANGTLLNVEGNGSATVDITWNNAGNGVTYAWWLDAAGGNFTNPIVVVQSNNMGKDTMLTLDITTIDAVLASAGVNVGDTANLQWAVSAFAGNDTLLSSSVYTIDLVRGNVLNPFDLLSPPDGTPLNVTGLSTQTVDITWSSSTSGASYFWALDANNGNFSSPIVTVPSNNGGVDTTVTLDYATIDAVLSGAGVTVGNTANLDWTAFAVVGSDTIYANQIFGISLTRGTVYNDFSLITPANGTAYNNQGLASQQISVTWSAASPVATYEWILSTAGANPTELARISAGNNTNLILTFGDVENVLISAGLPLGGVVNLDWEVEANINGTIITSDNGPFDLGVQRGEVISNFDLLTPSNGFTATVEGDPTQQVNITWESAGEFAEYTWLLDVDGGDYSNPIVTLPSGNNGADTSLVLDFETLSGVLANAGLNLGDDVDLIWTVRAFGGPDSIQASSFDLNLTRGEITSVTNISASSFGIGVYPNPTSGLLNIEFTQTLDQSADYTIFNVTGKAVNNGVFTGQNTVEQIDLGELSTGLYFLKVQAKDEMKVVRFSVQ